MSIILTYNLQSPCRLLREGNKSNQKIVEPLLHTTPLKKKRFVFNLDSSSDEGGDDDGNEGGDEE